MAVIPNSYKRGDLKGLGFEADFGGVRVHCIAWEDAQVERLRDDPVFTEGLIIDPLNLDAASCGPLVIKVPDFKNAANHEKAIEALKEMNRGAILVPGALGFEAMENEMSLIEEFTKPLKDKIAELEGKLAESVPVDLSNLQGEVKPDGSVEVFAPIGTVSPEVITEAIPEVLSTSEPITPAVTETPAVTTQEPVVASASEQTPPDSSTAAAPDLPSDEEAWKPVPGESEAQTVRSYLTQFGIGKPTAEVIAALKEFGVVVSSSQVAVAKKALR